MPFGITPLHVIVVLLVALILLGPRMLPRLGAAAGKSIREFRQAAPAARDAFTSEMAAPPSADTAGRGAAAGTKVGTAAGRSIRGLREALSETGHAFSSEVSPTPAAASSPPAPVPGADAAPAPAPTGGSLPSGE